MNDKPIAFLVYALCGMVLALSPVLTAIVQPFPARVGVERGGRLSHIAAAGIAGLLGAVAAHAGLGPLKILAALAAALWIGWRGRTLSPLALVGTAAIALAGFRLIWWTPVGAIPPWTVLVASLALFLGGVELLARRPANWERTVAARAAPVILFGLLSAFVSFSTGLYTQDEILFTTWHHWSAYIGPAELMRAGARILYDTPAQYGLGPTAVVALACGANCWKGMYLAQGLADLLYGGAVAYVVLRLAGPDRGLGRTIVLLAAVFAACFLFTAYPPALATPAIAPSEGGLRFLPCALLLAFLVACADKPWTRDRRAAGHGLWFLGLVWSPEAAFDATFVWSAYFLWRDLPAGPTPAAVAGQAVRRLAVLAGVLMAFIVGFCGLYLAFYRVLPSPYAVVAYLLHPPGSAPFAFTGTFWFLALVFALAAGAAVLLIRRGEGPEKLRLLLPVLLGLYAVGSYYLGRSNDNNVLNLGPFMVLALAAVGSLPSEGRLRIVAQAGLCCLLALPPSFGWSTFWGSAASQGRALRIAAGDPAQLFTFADPEAVAALDRREGARNPLVHSADIERAATQIWRDRHESVLLIAPPLVLVSEHSQPWAAMHAPETFWFMPPFARQTFLSRTMHRLSRPGWVITQPDAPDSVAVSGRELARDFDAVYARGESLRFGAYIATRYAPRP